MLKRKTIETVEEYDSNGKLVKKTVTETQEDDPNYLPYFPITYPLTEPYDPVKVWNPEVTYGDTTGCKPT